MYPQNSVGILTQRGSLTCNLDLFGEWLSVASAHTCHSNLILLGGDLAPSILAQVYEIRIIAFILYRVAGVAYADWSAGDYAYFHEDVFQNIFNQMDFSGMSDEEIAEAEELFETGWANFDISEDDRYQARMDFAEIMNYEVDFKTGAPVDFDWSSFRDAYDGANG